MVALAAAPATAAPAPSRTKSRLVSAAVFTGISFSKTISGNCIALSQHVHDGQVQAHHQHS